MTSGGHWLDWHTCDCGKRAYKSRKAARKILSRHHHPGRMHPYEHPGCTGWHLGTKPTALIRGTICRNDCVHTQRKATL